MKYKIGSRPKFISMLNYNQLRLGQLICGEITIDNSEKVALGIRRFFSKAPPRHPEWIDLPRDIFLAGLKQAYTKAFEMALGWERLWLVNENNNYRNTDGNDFLVSIDFKYCFCPTNLIYYDFNFGCDSCEKFFLNIKKGKLPQSNQGDLFYLDTSLMIDNQSKIGLRSIPPEPTEPTPPEVMVFIEQLLQKNSGPKFRKFPDKRQAEILKAAQAALTMMKLPTDPSVLNPEEVVQAIDREVQEFRLLGETTIPDILVAAFTALYGYCLVWAYGAEWKLAPKDEGDIPYIIGRGEDGWAQPSDLVRSALQGTKHSSLLSSFKSFHRA